MSTSQRTGGSSLLHRIAAVAAAASACLFTAAHAAEPIKIGLIQPLTGSVAYNGLTNVNGAKLAVEQVNKAGGVLGRPVALVVEDGVCRPATTVNAAERLLQKEQVVTLVGAFCSSSTAAIQPIAEKAGIPLVTGVSSEASLTEKGLKYFFRAAETDVLLADAFAQILADELKLKTVAYIGVNDDWGRGGIAAFSKGLTAHGVKNVGEEHFEHGATDYYTLLTKLRALKADGVFVAAETQDGSLFVKQAKEMGLESKIFGVGSWATADFIGLAGEAAEGIYAAIPYTSTLPGERNQAFVEAYQAAYEELPGKYSAAGYNALNIVMQAIERAGSSEPGEIRDALRQTDYQGPNGTYRFDAKGQAYGFTVSLVQIQNKEPVIVTSGEVAKPIE